MAACPVASARRTASCRARSGPTRSGLCGSLPHERSSADRHLRSVVVDDELLAGESVVAVGSAAAEVADAVEPERLAVETSRHVDLADELVECVGERGHDEAVQVLESEPGDVLHGDVDALQRGRRRRPASDDEHLAVGAEHVRRRPAAEARPDEAAGDGGLDRQAVDAVGSAWPTAMPWSSEKRRIARSSSGSGPTSRSATTSTGCAQSPV